MTRSSSHTAESILVATDLTPAGDRVVATAAHLVHAAGAELRVLHALDLTTQGYAPDGPVMPSFGSTLGETVRQLDAQIRRTAIHPDVRVSRQVVIRGAAQAILEMGATGFDLIVLGTHSRVGSPMALGSTARRVSAESRVPCLMVGSRAEYPFRRVAVAHDLADSGRVALEGALHWAAIPAPGPSRDASHPACDIQLDIVHVFGSLGRDSRQSRDRRARLKTEIAKVLPLLSDEEGMRIHPVVLTGSPELRFSVFASTHESDLVVAGVEGASPGRSVYGLTPKLRVGAGRSMLLIPVTHGGASPVGSARSLLPEYPW